MGAGEFDTAAGLCGEVGVREIPLSPLGEHLVEVILARFPERRPAVVDDGVTVIVVPALHPAFGDIEIDDDEWEITVHFGVFTHVHFGNDVDGLPVEQKKKIIVEDVCNYLNDVFMDRVEFFARWWGGGCGPRGKKKGEVFVWSSPVPIFND